MKKNLFLALFFVFFFYGCGGGASTSSSGITTLNETNIAYFEDSTADGVEYECGTSISGITGDGGSRGSFRFKNDCIVEFKIGKMYLGSLNGSQITKNSNIYPPNILGLSASTINENVENLLVFFAIIGS